MLNKVLGRAGVALAASVAVLATAVPANAAGYSAFAFSRRHQRADDLQLHPLGHHLARHDHVRAQRHHGRSTT